MPFASWGIVEEAVRATSEGEAGSTGVEKGADVGAPSSLACSECLGSCIGTGSAGE